MVSTHQTRPRFRIVPAMDLDDFAHSAFIGAKYHLEKIKEYINRPSIQTMWNQDNSLDEATKKTYASEVNQFHWHVRAFFWELIATYDTILQWANQRYELGLPEGDVKWAEITRRLDEAKKDQLEWKHKYALLEDAWNSDWFFEVRQYRNFAHRAFMFIQAEYDNYYGKDKPKLKKICLPPARVGQREYVDLATHISEYLDKMSVLGKKIFEQQTP